MNAHQTVVYRMALIGEVLIRREVEYSNALTMEVNWTIAIERSRLRILRSRTPSRAVPSAEPIRSDLAMADSLYWSQDTHRQGL